jgi:hypothetical protein
VFLLAFVSFPILGIDFLRQNSLVVDVANLRLSLLPPQVGTVIAGGSVDSASAAQATLFWQLLSATGLFCGRCWQMAGDNAAPVSQGFFQGVAASSLALSHGVQHVIQTVGQPATAKFWWLDPVRLAPAKQEFQSLLDDGIIRQSSSQWSSLLHMVLKTDGSWQPCGDYRQLNLQTVKDKYPLLNMEDLATRLEGCRLFTKLDLRKGYMQILRVAADIAKTAIITPFGLFEFICKPCGLCNAGMAFQQLMDSVLGRLPFASVYLDDILVPHC